MRRTLLLLFLSIPLVAPAQPDVLKPVDWKQVSPESFPGRLAPATPSPVQQSAIARLILHCCESEFPEPVMSTPDQILHCLVFEEIPLALNRKILLIEDGCFRAGTSGAVPMWLVRLDGNKPTLLASPEADFKGSLYSIQSSTTNGYRDIVLGWHWSASETGLTYFRFQGESYTSVSTATAILDEAKGTVKIVSK